MATQEVIDEVREALGEVVPDGGSETDTLFTNDQIDTWVDNTSSTDAAILRGWKIKLAHFANLVNVTDGASSRELSDLFAHAQDMVKMYNSAAVKGPTAGRSRVGKIVRS